LQARSKGHLEGCFKLKIGWAYRAFLVAMGSTQIPKINVDEAFSPITRIDPLHSLLALAMLEDWHKGLCSLRLSMACSRVRNGALTRLHVAGQETEVVDVDCLKKAFPLSEFESVSNWPPARGLSHGVPLGSASCGRFTDDRRVVTTRGDIAFLFVLVRFLAFSSLRLFCC
jgi:hypothetical protein